MKRKEFEGECVCGKQMRKVSEHLEYVVWKCESCGRKETRRKGARPFAFERSEAKAEVSSSYLVDVIAEVLEEEKKGEEKKV